MPNALAPPGRSGSDGATSGASRAFGAIFFTRPDFFFAIARHLFSAAATHFLTVTSPTTGESFRCAPRGDRERLFRPKRKSFSLSAFDVLRAFRQSERKTYTIHRLNGSPGMPACLAPGLHNPRAELTWVGSGFSERLAPGLPAG